MRVEQTAELQQVVLRHDTRDLVLRAVVLVVLGIGVPAWVEATLPALIVPALLVTLATAFWLVQALSAVLVLDEAGVTTSAARRGRGRTPWSVVETIGLERFRVVVRTTTGVRIEGPPATAADLEDALAAAHALGIVPPDVATPGHLA